MTDIDKMARRLRDIAENGLRQDGEECMFLASVATALESLQRELSEQAERHAFMVAELTERAEQIAALQDTSAALQRELKEARKDAEYSRKRLRETLKYPSPGGDLFNELK